MQRGFCMTQTGTWFVALSDSRIFPLKQGREGALRFHPIAPDGRCDVGWILHFVRGRHVDSPDWPRSHGAPSNTASPFHARRSL